MRFVLAIVAFVVAAVMIVAGIAQRTVFAPPSKLSATATVASGTRYIVIDSAVLNAHPGRQTLSLSGATDPAKQVVAYGRTADVKAWLGMEKYASVGYDSATGRLTAKTVTPKAKDSTSTSTPTPTPAAGADDGATVQAKAGPNPAGSDLWLEEFNGPTAGTTRMALGAGLSVIVASDGTAPAPRTVQVTWPVDTSTPWAFPLIVSGLVLLVIGIALYLWGLYAHRKARGPRRKSGPKMPKLPKAPKYKPASKPTPPIETSRGRRSSRRSRAMLPAALAGVLALGGLGTGAAVAETTSTPSPTTTTVPSTTNLPPAVTVPQLERILKRISASAADADANANSTLAADRFAGAALQLREANYTIRSKKTDEPMLMAIPEGPLELTLPQATDSWPRTVMTVIKTPNDAEGKEQAPLALALVQSTPRDNYQIEYAVVLQPKTTVPNLAPASIGAAVVPPDSKLLKMRPDEVGTAYGDILLNGESSTWAASFDLADDKLLPQVGQAFKQQEAAKLQQESGSTSQLTWTSQQGKGLILSMATNDSGAIVWVNPEEVQLLKPTQAGARVKVGPTAAAFTGTTESLTGFQTTFAYQLAFYVPPAGSSDKVRLLGYASGLVASAQVQ